MAGNLARVPEWIWAPATAAMLAAAVGAAGMTVGMPWLFPSLGPTIFIQVHDPDLSAARPYNVLVGHALGILAAVIGVLVTGAGAMPSVLATGEPSWPRVWASVIALALSLLAQVPLKAAHPPAAATALLIALGGFRLDVRSMLILAAGILLTAGMGEVLRRLRQQDRADGA